VVWEAISIFVGLFSIALAVYFGTRGLGGKFDLLGSKLDLLIEKVDSIKEDTSIVRDKVILIEGRTREGSPLDSFKGVVKKV
jgi:hypothetical protein